MANIPGININLNFSGKGFAAPKPAKKAKTDDRLKKRVSLLSEKLGMIGKELKSAKSKSVVKEIRQPKTIIKHTVKTDTKGISILARKLQGIENEIKQLPHTAHSGGG